MKALRALLAALLLASPASAGQKGASIPKVKAPAPLALSALQLPASQLSASPLSVSQLPVTQLPVAQIPALSAAGQAAAAGSQAAPQQQAGAASQAQPSPETQAAQAAHTFDGSAQPALSERDAKAVASISQAIETMRRHHLSKPAADRLAQKALRGMLVAGGKTGYRQALPYYRALKKALNPQVRGAGLFLARTEQNVWVVTRVEPGSPAAAAGIQANDALDAVDGVPLWNKTGEEINARFAEERPAVLRLGRRDEEGRVDFFEARVTPSVYTAAGPAYVAAGIARFFRAAVLKLAPADPKALTEGALAGIGRSLDMFTRYVPAAAVTSDHSEPAYGGVGVMLKLVPGGALITGVLPGGPAHRAGMAEGDLIRSVAGEQIEGLTIEQVHELIRRPMGTAFTADVEREGRLTRYVVAVEAIHMPAAAHARVDETTGYLHLTSFTQASVDDALRRLAKMASIGLKNIILDLRFNPGGEVPSALKLASAFLPKGATVLSLRGTSGFEDHAAQEDGPFKDLAVSILVNRFTASSAEIVTAALSENGRAVVVGEQTYGKGVGQSGYHLQNGGMLWVTSFRWLTPRGNNIGRGRGIMPGAPVEQDVPALERARAFIAELIFTQKPKSTDAGVEAAYRAMRPQAQAKAAP